MTKRGSTEPHVRDHAAPHGRGTEDLRAGGTPHRARCDASHGVARDRAAQCRRSDGDGVDALRAELTRVARALGAPDTLEPQIVGPHTPDLTRPVSQMGADAEANDVWTQRISESAGEVRVRWPIGNGS